MQTKNKTRTMIAVLMALMMVFLGGVTAHLDTVDTVSTQEQMTIDVTDYSSSTGPERRSSRQRQNNDDNKNQRRNSQNRFNRKRAERRKTESPSQDGKEDARSALQRIRKKANSLAASLRRSSAKRLSIPTPEEQAEKLARMLKGGAPLTKWVKAVKSEIDFALSVPYQIDYIFHSVLQYGVLKEKSDVNVTDVMHAVQSVYPNNLKTKKLDFTPSGNLGKDQKGIQNQYVAQTELSGWKTKQKKDEVRVAKVVERLKEALMTAIGADGEVVTYDEEKYSLPFDGQPGNEDERQNALFEERLLLPTVQLHLLDLYNAHNQYLQKAAATKGSRDALEKVEKDNPGIAKQTLALITDGVEAARDKRSDAVNSLLNEVARLYTLDSLSKKEWVKQSKNKVMKEFQENYTPESWKAWCGDIEWNFHSGFSLYFAVPIRVMPLTTTESGKKITWNVPIDEQGYATVLKALGGRLYTVENPMERVMRSKAGNSKPTVAMRIPAGKNFLQRFDSENKKKGTKKSVISDYQGAVKHLHVSPSSFSGLIGYMGPSNGAFVKLGSEKDGKHTIRGDEYSYTRLNTMKLPNEELDTLFSIDKALGDKHDHAGKKLRGWWMQANNKEDVPDPAFGKKRDQKLPRAPPQKKAGANRQKGDSRRHGNPLADVKDIEIDGYDPKAGPVQASSSYQGFVQSPRGPEHPDQGIKVLKDSELPERPTREKKGATAPASRRQTRSTESATINADLQPFTEPVDYEAMTVAKLKELLKAADLKVSGKKADLIERLKAIGQ